MNQNKQCKAIGLKGLGELSDITGVSHQTLSNWCRDKPKLFNIVLKGAYFEKSLNYFKKDVDIIK